jgi:hypothetical protein
MNKDSHTLSLIPKDLFPIIQQYISLLDYDCFMNSSKTIFHEVKFETIYYQLTNKLSQQFLVNEDNFRAKILAKVKDPLRQIGLILENEDTSSGAENALPFPVNKLQYSNYEIQSLRQFAQIPNLKIYFFNSTIDSCHGLEGLQKLELSGFFQLIDISSLRSLTEVTLCNCRYLSNINPLSNLHRLKLIYCPKIEDVSCLRNIHDLTLEVCENISDISSLTNNRKIMIKDCPKIKSFDSLKTCKEISLTPNMVLLDLTIFENVKKLFLHHYTAPPSHIDTTLTSASSPLPALSIPAASTFPPSSPTMSSSVGPSSPSSSVASSVSSTTTTTAAAFNASLSAVLNPSSAFLTANFMAGGGSVTDNLLIVPPSCQKLILSESIFQIRNAFVLQSLHSLELRHCLTVRDEDVVFLSEIHTLKLVNCLNIHSLNGLNPLKNQFVTIKESNYKHGIKDFSSLKNIPKVHLLSCYHFNSGEDVENVSELWIENCPNYKDLSKLSNIQNLVLYSCNGVESLQGLYGVPFIEIKSCLKLTSLNGLGGNQKIVLSPEMGSRVRELIEIEESSNNRKTEEGKVVNWLQENYSLDESRGVLTFLRKQ